MSFFDKIIKAFTGSSNSNDSDPGEINWNSSNFRNPKDYPRRDPNRKLTKRLEFSYNRLIAYLEPFSTIEEGINQFHKHLIYIHPEHAKNFFNHPHVVRALDLEPVLQSETQSEAVNWWDVKSEDNSTTPSSSVPIPKSVDVCADVNCSKSVTAFDFRCFTCRKRFCDVHKGTGIDCKSCETLAK